MWKGLRSLWNRWLRWNWNWIRLRWLSVSNNRQHWINDYRHIWGRTIIPFIHSRIIVIYLLELRILIHQLSLCSKNCQPPRRSDDEPPCSGTRVPSPESGIGNVSSGSGMGSPCEPWGGLKPFCGATVLPPCGRLIRRGGFCVLSRRDSLWPGGEVGG